MIFIGVTIIMGLLAMAGVCVHFVQRRASAVKQQRDMVSDRRKRIHAEDQSMMEAFLDSVLNGKSLAESVPIFLKGRAELVPELGESAGAWAPDDVGHVLNNEYQLRLSDVNRKLLLPMTLSCIVVIAVTIAVAATMYTFLEKGHSDAPSQSPSSPPVTTSLDPYDPFAVAPPTNGDTP